MAEAKRKKEQSRTVAAPAPVESKALPILQIRVPQQAIEYATRVAEDQEHTRSKMDGVFYTRGIYLTALIQGPGEDGTYGGLSPAQLARKMRQVFILLNDLLREQGQFPDYLAGAGQQVLYAASPMMAGFPPPPSQGAMAGTYADTAEIALSSESNNELDDWDNSI